MKNFKYFFSLSLSSQVALEIEINGERIEQIKIQNNEFSFIFNSKVDSLNLKLIVRGDIGTYIMLQITDERNKVFKSTARILNKGIAIQNLKISAHDFNTSADNGEPVYRETIKLGKQKKGFVKTIKEKSVVVPVFYITNRNSDGIDEETGEQKYGDEISELRKGIAEVNVPSSRKVGELNRPSLWKLEFSENLNKHFMLLSVKEFKDTEFIELISERIGKSTQQDAFCFIHGYNSSFKDCVLRTAQIAYDIGFEGAPIAMSWPSLATVMSYWDDEINIKSFSSHLIEFFKFFCKNTTVKKIHIIAHSMGNRALTEALVSLSKDKFFEGFEFNQIILAAPDLDAKVFLEEIAPNMSKCASRMTLYASSGDNALKASKLIHNSFLRLGESGEFITCSTGIDTIDASATDPSLLGHGYFSSTAPLINDIFQLFRFNTEPNERNLKKMISNETEYWRFR